MRTSSSCFVNSPSVTVQRDFIASITDFIFQGLALWRDSPHRPFAETEKDLNEQLCRSLDRRARHEEKNFAFIHEPKQTRVRRADMGVYGCENEYKNLTVIEAKRLPAPTTTRKREYLTGERKMTGGIQRFKAEEHGKEHNVAIMIGYIQQHDATYFQETINSWIDELSQKPVDALTWDVTEKLAHINIDTQSRTARTMSRHPRQSQGDITLHHLWVEMYFSE